jgi:hypothetical protein
MEALKGEASVRGRLSYGSFKGTGKRERSRPANLSLKASKAHLFCAQCVVLGSLASLLLRHECCMLTPLVMAMFGQRHMFSEIRSVEGPTAIVRPQPVLIARFPVFKASIG